MVRAKSITYDCCLCLNLFLQENSLLRLKLIPALHLPGHHWPPHKTRAQASSPSTQTPTYTINSSLLSKRNTISQSSIRSPSNTRHLWRAVRSLLHYKSPSPHSRSIHSPSDTCSSFLLGQNLIHSVHCAVSNRLTLLQHRFTSPSKPYFSCIWP